MSSLSSGVSEKQSVKMKFKFLAFLFKLVRCSKPNSSQVSLEPFSNAEESIMDNAFFNEKMGNN